MSTKHDSDLAHTCIAKDVTVQGDIQGGGHVRIDGKVIGKIQCHALVISETGVLEGDVSADNVQIQGRLFGTIKAQSVILSSSAYVLGDVRHALIEVVMGARVDGRYIPMQPGNSKMEMGQGVKKKFLSSAVSPVTNGREEKSNQKDKAEDRAGFLPETATSDEKNRQKSLAKSV